MSDDIGKEKEREVKAEVSHGSTLFVSNLPYTATSVDLQTLFSDIAPVRSAFVVTEPGTGVSKGVGYVSFALKEDAQSAFETIAKDGIDLVGRKLRVQWAETKPKEKGVKKEVEKGTKPKPPRPQIPHDPLAVRTIVVSGLPPSIDSKVLWKKIRKYDGAEKVDWPIEDDSSTAHVLFNSSGQAADAVSKLHAHVYKGSLLSVTLKKRLENLSKPIAQPKNANAASAAAPSHASRLIVRNIPFNATEQDLRAVFLPYGPIHSIHIPTDDKDKTPMELKQGEEEEESSSTAAVTAAAYAAAKRPRTKGFAFVWMLSKKDAEKAIEGCNGITVRAGTAETLVLDKQKKKKLKRLEMKRAKAAAAAAGGKAEEDGDEDEDEEVEKPEEDEKRAMERVIAVDWALSKERWKEEKSKMDEEDVEMGEGSESEDDNGDDDESGEDGLGVHGGSGDESDSSGPQSDDEGDEEERVRPELPPPETGTTLFIRNVPFNATEDELRTLFRSFGPLRYARITMDPATDRSRGTGFACFWKKEDADRAVQQSELLRVESTGVTAAPKKNPFSLPSILTPDPSSSLAQSLVLHGRTLDVTRAVTRDIASKLKEDNERLREKADKRNMYLLREGVIMPNSPAAANLTPAEVERRTSSFNARRALLKSNPSLFISKTRLSVRQIPIFVTERMVKRLALHSLKTFNAEVKQGSRDPLTADELAEPKVDDKTEEVQKEKTTAKKKGKFTGRDTGVKQTKIVRQAERVDPITGKGRSKGYGFVEMHRHSDALRFLRWANNNPEVGELFQSWWKDELESLLKAEEAKEKDRDEARMKRLKEEIEMEGESRKKGKGSLIVEFSIENIQVLQRRNAMQMDQDKTLKVSTPTEGKEKKRKRTSDAVTDGEDKEPKSPSKKPRQSGAAKAEETGKVKTESTKFTNPLGSIIGRKRKERKGAKKGAK